MQSIVFNSQKGGSGKTTLCAHLAVEAERAGHGPVVLIDTDPQGTLTTWHSTRQADTPTRIEPTFDYIAPNLEALRRQGTGFCFIDTAPSRTSDIAALFRLADLVIVPIRPSPSDLWAAAATVALVQATQRPFLFVLNQVKAQAAITAQTAAALSHHGPVAQTFIGDRVPYAAAFTDGRTAGELLPNTPAAREIVALWKHIQAYLHTINQTLLEDSHGQARRHASHAERP